ncbi:MAG: hypothetical protein ABR497_00635 [Kiritimatiellia bacterium]|nr:hypothetical protein [Lentisphaerota bacterium]
MQKHLVLGVHVSNRRKNVPAVQKLLTDYGSHIKTRLGMHDAGEPQDEATGLILLELSGPRPDCLEFEQKLKKLRGVQVKKMVFGNA